jgi:hypothetical protein
VSGYQLSAINGSKFFALATKSKKAFLFSGLLQYFSVLNIRWREEVREWERMREEGEERRERYREKEEDEEKKEKKRKNSEREREGMKRKKRSRFEKTYEALQ